MYKERKIFYIAQGRQGRMHYKENFEFIVYSASALFVNKTRTKQSLTHLIYDLSSLLVLIDVRLHLCLVYCIYLKNPGFSRVQVFFRLEYGPSFELCRFN